MSHYKLNTHDNRILQRTTDDPIETFHYHHPPIPVDFFQAGIDDAKAGKNRTSFWDHKPEVHCQTLHKFLTCMETYALGWKSVMEPLEIVT